MKVVGITGSPRKHSISTKLLNTSLEQCRKNGWDICRYNIPELNIEPCRACNSCHKTCSCIIQDAAEEIFRNIESAEFVIISSPVYFYSITGQLKVFIDRCQPVWVKRFIKKEHYSAVNAPCLFISTAGNSETENLFTASKLVIKVFANTMGLLEPDNILVADSDSITENRLLEVNNAVKEKTLGILSKLENI
ncbi:MAG: flavodoxin family protein [Planctomycetota bacterium]|jgi:multimeric flavodoxin WrbA